MSLLNTNRTRVTLTQVAQQAGVSIATVSQVLNRKQDLRVADQTRQRVLQVADEMGYKPDPRYRSVGRQDQHNRTNLGQLGLLLPVSRESRFISDAYYLPLLIAQFKC